MKRSLFVTGSSSWVPSSKSGLQFWFDASNLSSITKDGSNKVSQWNDLSGNARNAVQAAGTEQPVWTTNQQNGKPGIIFTAANSHNMTFGSSNIADPTGPLSFVIVMKNTPVGGTWYQAFIGIKTATANRSLSMFLNNDPTYQDLTFNFLNNPGSAGCRVTTSFSSTATAIVNYNGGGASTAASWMFYKNGSSATVNTSGSGTGNGSVNRIGGLGNTNTGLPYNGAMFELWCYNSQLTTQEVEKVTEYTTRKWMV